MIRATAAVLALLLIVPALGEAQEPVDGTQAVHRVTPGETLSHIALEYFGSARLWPQIFEANRNQVADPHWIFPWNTLVIPGVERPAGPAGPAVVTRVIVEGEEVAFPVAGFLSLEERRRLGQHRPFQPMGVPETGRERTVFFGRDEREEIRPQVLISPREEVAAIPRAVFHAAGWLATDESEIGRLGEIRAFAGDQVETTVRSTVHPYDEVRIAFDDPGTPRVGDHFLVYRPRRDIDGIGRVLGPSGRVEIVRLEAGGAIGRVVADYDRTQIGHLVTRMRTFPLSVGVHPVETDMRLEASVLGFQEEKALYLPGDFAFIDRGDRDGLEVGDELIAVAGGDEEWREETVGRVQVVGVRSRTATVRIMTVTAPTAVRPGLRLVLDRKMP